MTSLKVQGPPGKTYLPLSLLSSKKGGSKEALSHPAQGQSGRQEMPIPQEPYSAPAASPNEGQAAHRSSGHVTPSAHP